MVEVHLFKSKIERRFGPELDKGEKVVELGALLPGSEGVKVEQQINTVSALEPPSEKLLPKLVLRNTSPRRPIHPGEMTHRMNKACRKDDRLPGRTGGGGCAPATCIVTWGTFMLFCYIKSTMQPLKG